MSRLRLVPLPATDPHLLDPVVGERRAAALTECARRVTGALGRRAVVNVSSTATGGGVAEMLATLLPYARGAGVDARWTVIAGSPAFFAVTKRVHNALYGSAGDGGPLGSAERATYEDGLRDDGDELAARLRPGDVVVLHDPQTAGLAPRLVEDGCTVVWRCHVGTDGRDEHTDRGWDFLRPYLAGTVHAFVFTRAAYAPEWVDPARLHVVTPSVDPLSAKNQDLPPAVVRAILTRTGLLAGLPEGQADTVFRRADGSPDRVDRVADVLQAGPPPHPDAPLVVQVSRWDRMKDMSGVLRGFAAGVAERSSAHLVLVGPNVTGVADDPEGGEVLQECMAEWQALPAVARRRTHLACLPMTDPAENAAVVNAVQRHATVVVQKSVAEGFGLTVAEAMWKGRPVVASAVGGIPDQVVHEETGLLLPDPGDLDAFAAAVLRLLDDPPLAERLGRAAHERVRDRFLDDQHLLRFGSLLLGLLEDGTAP